MINIPKETIQTLILEHSTLLGVVIVAVLNDLSIYWAYII